MNVESRFFACPLSLLKNFPEFGYDGPLCVAYETYGTLSPARDNAILLFHALTGSQHAAGINKTMKSHTPLWSEENVRGWWDDFIGPGKALDTDKFFIVCANYLGGCYGSLGPGTIDPKDDLPIAGRFPFPTVTNIVDSQFLLLDSLGIDRVHALVGASLGGILALDAAVRYAPRVGALISIASGFEVSTLQRLHNFEQMLAIRTDPHFNQGFYYNQSAALTGLAFARVLAHKSYISLDEIDARARNTCETSNLGAFSIQPQHPLESYMLYQASKFTQRFDANSYLRIVHAWQNYDLKSSTQSSSIAECFSRCVEQKHLIISIDSDVCFFPCYQDDLERELKSAGVASTRITVHSDRGHDAFLLEPGLIAPQVGYFLQNR